MSRLSWVGALAAAAALAVLSSAALAATGTPELTVTASRFPDREYVLNLPTRQRLNDNNVIVTENGARVENLTVSTPGAQTATMLLVDASLSMKGKPIADAIAAARAFAAQRNPSQRIAIATFNSKITLLLPFTNQRAEISEALSTTPPTAYGTVIYDAVEYAIEQIKTSGARVGTIVLLSDGQNVGSKNTVADAVRKLRENGIRLFSVGLQSPAYYAPPLRRMAEVNRGTYTEASDSTALKRIYDELGFRLANEYLLLYRSLAGPQERIEVAVRVPGYATALRTSYTTPALDLYASRDEETAFDQIIQSQAFMFFMVAAIIGLVIWGIALVIGLHRRTVRTRIGEFVDLAEEAPGPLSREELSAAFERLGDSVKRRGWLQKFAEQCEIGDVQMAPTTLLLAATGIGAFLAIVLSVLWNPLAILLLPLAPVAAMLYVRFQVRRQRKLFAEQLPDNLDVLAAALRVGHSLIGGLAHMAEDASMPSKREFRLVVADEQLGIPLEDALHKMAHRMESRDAEHVALVAMLQRETGGSSADVINQVTENIRARMEVRRLVHTLTAQGRLARWIVSAMPPFLVLAILFIYPTYLDALFGTTVGVIAMIVAAIMVMLGSYVIKRIVEIKV